MGERGPQRGGQEGAPDARPRPIPLPRMTPSTGHPVAAPARNVLLGVPTPAPSSPGVKSPLSQSCALTARLPGERTSPGSLSAVRHPCVTLPCVCASDRMFQSVSRVRFPPGALLPR